MRPVDLLLLARLETDTSPWEEASVDVSQLCERIAEQMQPLAAERTLSLGLDIEPGLLVTGSFDHLLRALLNLLDNAIKYADSPGRIVWTSLWPWTCTEWVKLSWLVQVTVLPVDTWILVGANW